MPTTGRAPLVMPMLITACKKIVPVNPAAESAKSASDAQRQRQWREIGLGAQILKDLGVVSIRNLVTTSSQQISEGVNLVESSGDALQQVVSEVTLVAGLVDEIAGETAKQAQGIAEINEMMASMDNVTQQNAAMVEESTASARNLSSETVRLTGKLANSYPFTRIPLAAKVLRV